MSVKIELLYFDGCPHYAPTEQLLRETLSDLGVNAEIELVNVLDQTSAQANRFLGSPSIRVNGRDLELNEGQDTQYSMRCRLYRSSDGLSGMPPKGMMADAIRTALANNGD